MTVHAAKGLEFPVVVLCDPTAPKRLEWASRYIDPERKLWAQSLCDAEPLELYERREEVCEHDAAEIVRLAYVAATRAQDLLVVPVAGDAPIDGWLDVLTPALYPPLSRRRTPEPPRPDWPAFGPDSVADRADHIPPDSVAPGEHRPELGEHRVLWWDPNLLELKCAGAAGLDQSALLRVDEQNRSDEAGLIAYRDWHARRSALLTAAACPSRQSVSMTALAQRRDRERGWELPALGAALQIIDLGLDRGGRPSGPRFGTLVHALLANLSFEAEEPAAELPALGLCLARSLAASDAERACAVADLCQALAHPFFARVRAAAVRGELDREAPVAMASADGVLLDGVVDLVFREQSEQGPCLWLVDFKTDAELGDGSRYADQLALYAQALARARALPVHAILVRI